MSIQSTLYYNATIVTGDRSRPRAEAMLVADGAIAAVGRRDEVADLAPVSAAGVDLDGATVVPGFNDCHMHILSMGLGLSQLDLTPNSAPSILDICRLVAARAAKLPDGHWILGRGYNQNLLSDRRHPTSEDLDGVSGDHPVVIWHTSGHVVVANTAALRAAEIGLGTPDPVGGEIQRDSRGVPTGILKENAMKLVRAAIPLPTLEQARDAILQASEVLAAEGITSASDAATGQIHEMRNEARIYRMALETGRLKTRVVLMPVIEQVTADAVAPSDLEVGELSEWLSVGAAKVFTDGALTTRTAAMRQPYASGEGDGILTWDGSELVQRCRQATALGWQLAAHAIGDRAVEQVLDTFASIGLAADARPRIEHATICDSGQIARMKDLGVSVVLQPEDIAVLGDAYPPALGSDRARDNSPVAWFREVDLPIAFSSDRPVTPGDPLVGVRAAVERMTPSGAAQGPAHRISAETAIGYYTQGSAWATRSETWRGALRPGLRADFVVLDRDITACESEEITQASVLRTVIDGESVHEA